MKVSRKRVEEVFNAFAEKMTDLTGSEEWRNDRSVVARVKKAAKLAAINGARKGEGNVFKG